MSIVIKDDDLIVVEAGNGAGVGTYSGYDLKEDIKQMIADRDIKLWYQKDPPPDQGSPDYAGLYDFWFDPSISALFIMVETEATVINSYTWVIVDPGDRKRLLQDANSTVKFPVGTSGQVWSHPETGVEYYFKFDRNQWIDIYAPAEDSIEANQDSIKALDDKVEDRVKIAGDTMTGNLTMQPGTIIDVGEINNLSNLIPAETLLVEADQTTRYSRIKPVGPRPVTTGVATGMIIDLSEDDQYNNLVVMGNDTILSINGRNNTTNVQFNTRVNAPSVQLSDSGGLLLRTTGEPAGGNKDLIRAYYDKTSGANNRLIDFYFDGSSETTKLQIDNHPLKITCTDGTQSPATKEDLIRLSISQTDDTVVGSYCSIHRLIDPVGGMDAVNLQTLNTKVGDYLPLAGGTTTGHVKCTKPGATTSDYILSVEAPHLDSGKQVAFRVTGNGKVKAGHDYEQCVHGSRCQRRNHQAIHRRERCKDFRHSDSYCV